MMGKGGLYSQSLLNMYFIVTYVCYASLNLQFPVMLWSNHTKKCNYQDIKVATTGSQTILIEDRGLLSSTYPQIPPSQ